MLIMAPKRKVAHFVFGRFHILESLWVNRVLQMTVSIITLQKFRIPLKSGEEVDQDSGGFPQIPDHMTKLRASFDFILIFPSHYLEFCSDRGIKSQPDTLLIRIPGDSMPDKISYW